MTQTKWGLLIGINRYQRAATPLLRDLNGAVADVEDMRELLERTFEFNPARIVTLVDEQATREGIVKAIRTHLAAQAEVNDVVVIHFSGHGSFRVRDGVREGTLVAHDSRSQEGWDLDAEALSGLLQTIRARNVTLVLDSCHSGNLIESRGLSLNRTAARTIPPDSRKGKLEVTERSTGRKIPTMRAPTASFALLCAAGPLEWAFERDLVGKCRGAFTYCFSQELRRSGARVTYRDVMDRVQVLVHGWFAGQSPRLEGALRNQFVFDDKECAPPPYVLVEPEGRERVRMAAGRVHGVTTGSYYGIHAPGEKNLAGSEAMATVQVVETKATASLARVISGEDIAPASRAIEIDHRGEGSRVLVRTSGIEKLNERLRSYQHLEVLNECDGGDRQADITITAHAGLLWIQLPSLGPQPAKGNKKFKVASAESLVLHWAKWLNVARIQNEDAKLDLTFNIAPSTEGLAGDEHGAAPVFYDGDRIHYHIENKSGNNLSIGLLALGDDGSVCKVFPTESGSKLLMPGLKLNGTLDVERLQGRKREFNILKLFAALQDCDYGLLEMGGLPRKGFRGRPLNVLEELLVEAAFGQARRIRSPVKSDEWITKQRNVMIRRLAVS